MSPGRAICLSLSLGLQRHHFRYVFSTRLLVFVSEPSLCVWRKSAKATCLLTSYLQDSIERAESQAKWLERPTPSTSSTPAARGRTALLRMRSLGFAGGLSFLLLSSLRPPYTNHLLLSAMQSLENTLFALSVLPFHGAKKGGRISKGPPRHPRLVRGCFLPAAGSASLSPRGSRCAEGTASPMVLSCPVTQSLLVISVKSF